MKGETVCDATVLITLTRIGRLHLLRQAFQRLVIPEAVYEEVVVKGANRPGADEVKEADWIRVCAIRGRQRAEELRRFLGKGESEAIVLAHEISASLVLLDDHKARTLAQQEGLTVVGTLGVLKGLREQGGLKALRPLFDHLRSVGFHMGEEYDHILRQVGEKCRSPR